MFNALILLFISLIDCISVKMIRKKKKNEEEVKHEMKFKVGKLIIYWLGIELFSVLLFFLEIIVIVMLVRDIKIFLTLSKSNFILSNGKGAMNLNEIKDSQFINFFQFFENKYARVFLNNITLILCSLIGALSLTYCHTLWTNFRLKIFEVIKIFTYWACMFIFLIFIFSFAFFSLFGSPSNSFKDMPSR
jgi:hypothetical protein